MVFYISLLILYVMVTFILISATRSPAVFIIKGNMIPASAFTGVLFSIANLLIILMVVFIGRLGFISGIVLLISQFPIMIRNLILGHNNASISGFFTKVFTIITIILIYRRNEKIAKYQSTEMGHLKEKQKFPQHFPRFLSLSSCLKIGLTPGCFEIASAVCFARLNKHPE